MCIHTYDYVYVLKNKRADITGMFDFRQMVMIAVLEKCRLFNLRKKLEHFSLIQRKNWRSFFSVTSMGII